MFCNGHHSYIHVYTSIYLKGLVTYIPTIVKYSTLINVLSYLRY